MPSKNVPETADTDDECAAWFAKKTPEAAARAAYDLALRSDKDNMGRRNTARRDCSAYEGINLSCYGPHGYSDTSRLMLDSPTGGDDGSVPVLINVAKSIVQTMVAKVACMSRPKTQVVTSYGKWKDRRAAVQIDRLIEADFQQSHGWQYPTLWQMGEHGYKLAHGATGTVGIKVSDYPNSSKVHYQLLDTLDMFFDLDELTYGQPLTLGCSTWWNPHQLAVHFPEHEDEIMASLEEPPEGLTPINGDGKRSKMVRVVEVWRLAVGADCGRYIICIKDGVDLTRPKDVDYEYDTFPIALYHADKHLTGPWAQSTVAVMYEALRMLNECVLSCAKAEASIPKAAIHFNPDAIEENDVKDLRDFQMFRKKTAILGEEGHTIVPSEPPDVLTPAPFDRMNLEWINWLITIIHDLTGVSESSAEGTREKGITSAEGQRAVAALGAERFAQSAGDYIQWLAVDTAKLSLRCMKRIHERDGSFTRNWIKPVKSSSSTRFLRQIDSSVLAGLDDNKYILAAAPVGREKNTPADRIQQAVEAVQYGIISPQRLPGLQAHLDTPGEVQGLDGQREWIEDQIDRWLYSEPDELDEPGFYKGPLPSFNLEDATLQVLDAFYRADIDVSNDPEEDFRIDFFTQFLTELDALSKQKAEFQAQLQNQQAQPPAAPAQAAA